MALDDSVLLEMIEMLHIANGGTLLRRLRGGVGQAEIDAEATEHIGAAHQRCAQLDADVAIWRTRTMKHIAFPCVLLDATYGKVGLNGWVVSPSRRRRDRRQCRR